MKEDEIMDAPEKIYLNPALDALTKALNEKTDEDDVEYTRTDVFIDKACKWLKCNYVEFTDNTRLGIKIDELIKDFKKDMEL